MFFFKLEKEQETFKFTNKTFTLVAQLCSDRRDSDWAIEIFFHWCLSTGWSCIKEETKNYRLKAFCSYKDLAKVFLTYSLSLVE